MTVMHLFHFSERSDIRILAPEAMPRLRVGSGARAAGVWATDDAHQAEHVFPHECPRILTWSRTAAGQCLIAYIEWPWLARLADTAVYRYTVPGEGFAPIDDRGNWISHVATAPIAVTPIVDVLSVLVAAEVELRVVPSLDAYRGSGLHHLH